MIEWPKDECGCEPEDLGTLHMVTKAKYDKLKAALAACRASEARLKKLLEKLQFSEQYYGEPKYACPICHCNEYHASNCAIDAELRGGERK